MKKSGVPPLVSHASSDPDPGAAGCEVWNRTLALLDAEVQVLSGAEPAAAARIAEIVRAARAALPAPQASAPNRAAATAWDHELTPREREVLALVCGGRRLSEIAALWNVSIKTVSTHKTRVMRKLQVPNNAALIKFGVSHGLA